MLGKRKGGCLGSDSYWVQDFFEDAINAIKLKCGDGHTTQRTY